MVTYFLTEIINETKIKSKMGAVEGEAPRNFEKILKIIQENANFLENFILSLSILPGFGGGTLYFGVFNFRFLVYAPVPLAMALVYVIFLIILI